MGGLTLNKLGFGGIFETETHVGQFGLSTTRSLKSAGFAGVGRLAWGNFQHRLGNRFMFWS